MTSRHFEEGKTGENTKSDEAITSKKVWVSLVTNLDYLPGFLTLEHSLRSVNSAYPLVALYTDALPPAGHAALRSRGIPTLRGDHLVPSVPKSYEQDPRFHETWSKLSAFSLTQFDRIVQLDSDMLVRRNMDELMELALDPPGEEGAGDRVFAASYACVCNPLGKPHYPSDWIRENCAFTSQHDAPDRAQTEGAPLGAGLAMPNSGLLVINPSRAAYELILKELVEATSTAAYEFGDQSLIGYTFRGRWAPLPYVYNALKTLRWKGVHDQIWRDERVKNVHYIMVPKPWDEPDGERGQADETHKWWWDANDERKRLEKTRGIEDEF
ncbi:glycosyl transferase family protein [Eremomyces bilateralis CBS 781.70]|uniref:Glycosyl transferase family protein n=1 Tax=Eremomyces bilateralis CBS 781.70 TaxID=1392243 RepID=A0A6G1GA57_9PEZI|nr:glycosyl transferase family protein [Eremomyces bilateralis CBS 781.70]KAF1814967.1 glycosyl transferase family protein [Eremomyces bilateralis CBS 781.70]